MLSWNIEELWVLWLQVRLRCQKGIPPALRGRTWLYLSGGKVKREQNQGKFQVSQAPLSVLLFSFLIPSASGYPSAFRGPVFTPLDSWLRTLRRSAKHQIRICKMIQTIPVGRLSFCVFRQELDNQPGDPKWVDVIEKDLHRQFPFHEMFVSRGGHG